MVDKNEIQKAIDQIGMVGVVRYLPKGMKLHNCEMHGMYLNHYSAKEPNCPICASSTSGCGGNGTTATEIEHLIDLKDKVQEAFKNIGC